MKSAEECKCIDDIRTCIDEIDRNIVKELVLRSTFVKRAAAFKKTVSDVKADGRVKSMMATRRNWALEMGINAEFIESIFGNIVGFFIGNELKDWDRGAKHTGGIALSEASVDDAADILSLQKRAGYAEEDEYTAPDGTRLVRLRKIKQ